jgi:hypothetical protein
MEEFKFYSFTYKHTNHSVFRGFIKATSEDNLNGQLKAKLFNRYRREQDINKAIVVEITQEEFEALQ